MKVFSKKGIPECLLPGRFMQKVIGDTASGYESESTILHVGYCRYCEEAGPMEPHVHSEEVVQILESDRAWVRFGPSKDNLNGKIELEKNMTLHIPSGEWHVFEYASGGSLEILFIYGAQVALS